MNALLIREFKLVPTGTGLGVSCDAEGAFIDSIPLLKRTSESNIWESCGSDELSEELGSHYGLPIDLSSKAAGLAAVARALNSGDIAQAQLITLHLKFPTPPPATNDLSDDGLIKFVRELYASALIKGDWDPDNHPRWPAGVPDSQGGQFAPAGEAAESSGYIRVADADPEVDEPEPEINGQTEAESLRASEIDNAAGEARARELGAEAAGEDTKETYQSQIDRQLFARQRAEFWKNEAAAAPRFQQLPPDAYTDSNLALMRGGRAPLDEDGIPYELHHPNGLPWEPLVPMTREDHRLGPNYLLNHPWLAKKMIDIFVDKLNSKRDLAGVLEADDLVSYFYLYSIMSPTDGRILGAVQAYRGVPDFTASDVEVRWFDGESKVGVFIKGALRAYFDLVSGKGFPVNS